MRVAAFAFCYLALLVPAKAGPPDAAKSYPPPRTQYILPAGFRGPCRVVFDWEHGQNNSIRPDQPGEVEILKIPVGGELRVKEDPWWPYLDSISDDATRVRVQHQWDVTAEYSDGTVLPMEDHRAGPARRPHLDDNAIALRPVCGYGRSEIDGVGNDGVIFLFVGTEEDAEAYAAQAKQHTRSLPPLP